MANVAPRMRHALVVSLTLVVYLASTPIAARIWTDSTGKYKIDAEFEKFEGGKVHLQTADGQPRAVPMSKLSAEDQAYVRAEIRKRRLANPPDIERDGSKKDAPTPPPELDSTETVKPTTYNSRNFILHTDVTPREAKLLLGSLETVLDNMEAYWGRPVNGQIECFVIRDLSQWPKDRLDPEGVFMVANQEGVTLTSTQSVSGKRGKQEFTKILKAEATVYAYADRGIAQHEAVHAYCDQTFGQAGPTWYAEGMAEMGQYWVKGSRAVNTPRVVVDFFRDARHRRAMDIVNEEQITGDSWENYTRRWALCHMLNHNPNYSARFRAIGQAIVDGQKINYREFFGTRAEQIEFEYRFFVEHLDLGYRVDLCSWDWDKRFLPLTPERARLVKVVANRGWQASSATVVAGERYQYSASGQWTTGDGANVDADGDADGDASGNGRLVGILMQDMQLGEPFKLGRFGTFTAPAGGQLYLRCQDAWSELGDNSGSLTVKLKGYNAEDPLSEPGS